MKPEAWLSFFAAVDHWASDVVACHVAKTGHSRATQKVVKLRDGALHTPTHRTSPRRTIAPPFYVRLRRAANDFFNPSKSNTDCSIP